MAQPDLLRRARTMSPPPAPRTLGGLLRPEGHINLAGMPVASQELYDLVAHCNMAARAQVGNITRLGWSGGWPTTSQTAWRTTKTLDQISFGSKLLAFVREDARHLLACRKEKEPVALRFVVGEDKSK